MKTFLSIKILISIIILNLLNNNLAIVIRTTVLENNQNKKIVLLHDLHVFNEELINNQKNLIKNIYLQAKNPVFYTEMSCEKNFKVYEKIYNFLHETNNNINKENNILIQNFLNNFLKDFWTAYKFKYWQPLNGLIYEVAKMNLPNIIKADDRPFLMILEDFLKITYFFDKFKNETIINELKNLELLKFEENINLNNSQKFYIENKEFEELDLDKVDLYFSKIKDKEKSFNYIDTFDTLPCYCINSSNYVKNGFLDLLKNFEISPGDYVDSQLNIKDYFSSNETVFMLFGALHCEDFIDILIKLGLKKSYDSFIKTNDGKTFESIEKFIEEASQNAQNESLTALMTEIFNKIIFSQETDFDVIAIKN